MSRLSHRANFYNKGRYHTNTFFSTSRIKRERGKVRIPTPLVHVYGEVNPEKCVRFEIVDLAVSVYEAGTYTYIAN